MLIHQLLDESTFALLLRTCPLTYADTCIITIENLVCANALFASNDERCRGGRIEGKIVGSANRPCSFELTIDSPEFDSGLRRRTSFCPALASRKARSIMSAVSKEEEPARFLVASFLLQIKVASSRSRWKCPSAQTADKVASRPSTRIARNARVGFRGTVRRSPREARETKSADQFARSIWRTGRDWPVGSFRDIAAKDAFVRDLCVHPEGRRPGARGRHVAVRFGAGGQFQAEKNKVEWDH